MDSLNNNLNNQSSSSVDIPERNQKIRKGVEKEKLIKTLGSLLMACTGLCFVARTGYFR
jgi:hypothetical protein